MMGGEEIDRHVPPVISFLGIELLDGHQFDKRDAQLLKIWNLLDQAGERAAILRSDAAGGAGGETLQMHFVDDGIRFVPLRTFSRPVEGLFDLRQNADRRTAIVSTGVLGKLAIELGREIDGGGIRIEQDFVRIKRVVFLRTGAGAFDAIGIIARIGNARSLDPAVPDALGLVRQMLKDICEDRRDQIVGFVEKQRHLLRVLGVERKVKRLLIRDPRHAQRRR